MQTNTSTPQVGEEKLDAAPVLNPGQNLISFEEAMAAMNGEKFLTEEETFLAEEELSTGGSSFTPNRDPNRVVTIKLPRTPGAMVKFKLKGKAQGITIDSIYLEDVFEGVDFAELANKTQLGLMLGNGVIIYGYAVITKPRRCMYIPKKQIPVEGVKAPSLHRARPVVVRSLIIG